VNSDDEDEETRAKRLAASTEKVADSKVDVGNIVTEPAAPAAGIHPSRLNNIERRPSGPPLQTNVPSAPKSSSRTPQGPIPSSPAVKDAKPKKEDESEDTEVTQPAPKRVKTEPKSFLDEILADRSKKGKKSKA
jgi:hypothetical protein